MSATLTLWIRTNIPRSLSISLPRPSLCYQIHRPTHTLTHTHTISIPLSFVKSKTKNLRINLFPVLSLTRSHILKANPQFSIHSYIQHDHGVYHFLLCVFKQSPLNLHSPSDLCPVLIHLIFFICRSPLRWTAWSSLLFVSLPVGVNNLTTELLQTWLPSRPGIGTVYLFMTLCGNAHVWDVQEWEDWMCVLVFPY